MQVPGEHGPAHSPALAAAARQGSRKVHEDVEDGLRHAQAHHDCRLACPAMLAEEAVERAMVLDSCFGGHALLAARAMRVNDRGVGHVHDPPAGPTDPIAPVGLFHEEEVVLGHETHLLEHLAAHDEAGTDHGLHVKGRRVCVALGGKSARPQRFQQALRHDLGHEARVVVYTVLLGAIHIEELGTDHADVGVRIEVSHAGLETVVTHQRVAVE